MGTFLRSPSVRRNLLILGVIGVLGAILFAPEKAQAKPQFLETVGTSVVIGTALGASTLPFYDEPSEHYSNILYGAVAGAAVGLGIWVYGLLRGGPTEEEKQYFPNAQANPAPKLFRNSFRTLARSSRFRDRHLRASVRSYPVSVKKPFSIWLPVVSLEI